MEIDEKTISCLQCGSMDVDMESEEQGTCKACGAKFIAQQKIDKQNTYSENNTYNSESIQEKEDSCKKYEIKPEYSKTEFMRRVWITLAKEDAPIEVFSENFDDVSIIEHQVVIDKLAVDTTYKFSVGYYRDEPYIDYETYYEDEPYITSESYYDTYTKTTKTRPVTKYKSVRKERQVTKYKKVTDWSNLNGTHRAQSTAFVENVEKLYLDDELFEESFREMKAGSYYPLPSDEAKSIKVAEFTKLLVRLRHNQNVEDSIINSLPGDDYRDLDWKVSGRLEQTTDLYKAPEYETTITYNGKTYKKYAFPFGTMEIGGDIIRNQLDLDTITEDMRNTLDEKEKERRDAIKKNVEKSTNVISLLTIVLLIISIVLSIFVRSTAVVVVAFIIAAGFFVFNTIAVKKADYNEKQKAEEEIAAERSRVETEIADYTKDYTEKKRKALDNKLSSLRLRPASSDEL